MSAYADTGFIVTLYQEESTSARAAALMGRQTASVRLSLFIFQLSDFSLQLFPRLPLSAHSQYVTMRLARMVMENPRTGAISTRSK